MRHRGQGDLGRVAVEVGRLLDRMAVEAGRHLDRMAVDLGRRPRGHRVVDLDLGLRRASTVVDLDLGLRRASTVVDLDLGLRRASTVVDLDLGLRRASRAVDLDLGLRRASRAVDLDLGLRRGNTAVRAGSHQDRTPLDHQPPNCAATSMGQADPVRRRVDPAGRRVDPMVASMGTTGAFGVREPPHPTSAGTSADRVGLMPASMAASTGPADRRGTSGRTSAVRARHPLGLGEAPAGTSALTWVD
jgi:hypothetical protein